MRFHRGRIGRSRKVRACRRPAGGGRLANVRRVMLEPLEDRRLLAMAKFDFNSTANEPVPGWTPVTLTDAANGTIVSSGAFGIKFTGRVPFAATSNPQYTPATVPSDAT